MLEAKSLTQVHFRLERDERIFFLKAAANQSFILIDK